MKYIIALDAGTTSVRAMLYDLKQRKFIFSVQQEVGQSFPQNGWVEQDAGEIYYKAIYALNRCVVQAGAENIAGIGIANQRETVLLWNRKTGEPIAPAIVWQCRRTSEFCNRIPEEMREKIRKKTGLPVDAYFSASKIRWLLENTPEATQLLSRGELCAGTIDSFLIFKLTGNFYTDHTNASRTMLFDIRKLAWDKELLDYFHVPIEILPEVKSCTELMGKVRLKDREIPIAGVAGDQQAALIGQSCLQEGDAKITYGTGLFLLFNTGGSYPESKNGLITTLAYTLGQKRAYALEGSFFHAGSCVQWLRDELHLIQTSAESEEVAKSVPDAGGVQFVPAFTGLGAPHWDGAARGLLCGISRGTERAHIVRAVLESIAFSARELCDCMQLDSGIRLKELKCDGGASANNFLMQFQADVLGIPVNRPVERESTALGAALLCAISLGIISEEEIAEQRIAERIFIPIKDRSKVEKGYQDHLMAVKRAIFKG